MESFKQVPGGSWETTGDLWKKFPCWACGTLYEDPEERDRCKASHPEDMEQVFMKPYGLDNYEPVKENKDG